MKSILIVKKCDLTYERSLKWTYKKVIISKLPISLKLPNFESSVSKDEK